MEKKKVTQFNNKYLNLYHIINKGAIYRRELPCFCNNCANQFQSDCLQEDIVGEWILIKQHYQGKRTQTRYSRQNNNN